MLTSQRISMVGLACLFGLTAVVSGCADADSCEDRTDCDVGEECVGGVCEEPTQVNGDDNDAQNDNQNNNEQANSNQPNNDGNQNNSQNNGQNNDGNQENNDPMSNPEVVSVEPADGTTGVAVDTQIRVTIDQAIDQVRLSDDSLQLRTPSSNNVDGQLEYNEGNNELVFTPDENLRTGTRYTIHTTSDIQSEGSLLPLAEQVTTWFITEWEMDEDIRKLAENYAPVVFQDLQSTSSPDVHLDMPTRVNFDDDYDADDNLGAAEQSDAEVPANVYYSVKSTESHHFIQYVLYYPGRVYDAPFDATTYEHDFAGLAVIVERESGDVQFVDGVHAGETSTDDRRLAYRPPGSPVETASSNPANEPKDIDSGALEDGTQFQLYVPTGIHAPCYWGDRSLPDNWFTTSPCGGDADQFESEDGVVLRHGEQAQTYDQASDEETDEMEMTYGMEPFTDPFWLRRGDYSCGLFSSPGFTYDPSADRPDGPGDDPAYLPRSLCSDQDTTYGTLPFRWLRNQATDASGGVWFMDPAHYLGVRYDFGEDYSDEYCYHSHFDIDRRTTVDCLPDECLVHDDCADGEVCDTDPETNVCVTGDCMIDDDCADGEVCDTDADPNACVVEDECTENADCADDEVCDTDADPNNQCVVTACLDHDDCAGDEVCDTDVDPNECIVGDCLVDGDCANDEICDTSTDPNSCVADGS